MAVMSSKQLSAQIKSIKGNRQKLQEQIQEALVSATFYAYKDGNVEPFNQLLDAVGNSMHKRGITLWVELVSGIARVEKGVFALNKKVRNESGVTNEENFAPVEEEIRKVAWYEVAGEQKVASVFDEDKYMDSVLKKLEKEGAVELASELRTALVAYHVKINGSVTDVQPQVRLAA